MAGSPPLFPSLQGIGQRSSRAAIMNVIEKGRGRMPAFPSLSRDELKALIDYLIEGANKELTGAEPASPPMPYRFSGYNRFLDADGYPAVAPPWGTLSAINLNTGEYAWKIPLGEYPDLAAQGMKDSGSENYGGPLVTAGGLLFIGATNYDRKFRAFDKSSGKLLWETVLPFAGNATPVAYEVNGHEYVVIAAGGGKDLRSKSGGVYVAFALPREK
jgi:quinoprotein glucose dehydrogenase